MGCIKKFRFENYPLYSTMCMGALINLRFGILARDIGRLAEFGWRISSVTIRSLTSLDIQEQTVCLQVSETNVKIIIICLLSM